ncbi:MAG: hypothetical protein JSS36_01755 [Proteobacteria bacterium]|nr:hypothetical protein [Pseudomonadota bacterium]
MLGIRSIGLALAALALASCGRADRDFDLVIHRDSGTVANALADIDLGETAALASEVQVQRSQPAENQLLYTVPGDIPERSITIRYELTALPGEQGTKVAVRLHVPTIELKDPKDSKAAGAVKVVSAMKVGTALHKALGELGKALDLHDSTTAPRREIGALLAALAVTNHPDLFSRMMQNPDAAASDALARMLGGQGGFGRPGISGEGSDPNPREDGGFGAAQNDARPTSPRGIDARPMDEARGTDPNPTE